MRSKLFRVAALAGVAVLALLLVVLRPMGHKLTLKTYFANGEGLRVGAPVRAAGVDVGSVRSVRVRPELKEEPVEVFMVLNTSYEIKIPSDSVVSLETAGVLGGTYVEIDTTGTSGPPIGSDAILKSRHVAQMSTEQFFGSLNKILEEIHSDCGTRTENASRNTTPARKSPPHKPTQ